MTKDKSNRKHFIIFIVCIIVVLFLTSVVGYVFRNDLSTFILKSKSYSKDDQLVTEQILMKDIEIMMAKEGVQGQVEILKNEGVDLANIKDRQSGEWYTSPKNGYVIHIALNNSLFSDSKKPLEVRFIARLMLYLMERNVDPKISEIVGVYGGFKRNAAEVFEGSQSIKMSAVEFEDLYREAEVSKLDTEEQINVLTHKWIEKTGYWRRGLFGKEER